MKHNVSKCCTAPMFYRKGTTEQGEEVMVPFCCICNKATTVQLKSLSKKQIERNKDILFISLFPGFPGFSKIKHG